MSREGKWMHMTRNGWFVGALAALAVGCGGVEDPGTGGKPLDHLALKAAQGQATIAVGESWQLVATGFDAAGGTVTLGSVTWTSSAPAIVAVDADGKLTGKAHGSATISAESAGKKANVEVQVVGAVHEGYLAQSETWHAIDNPHRILGDVMVAGTGTPVLTIEAGVEARFAEGATLRIGSAEAGSLHVDGTADKPVHFVADAPTPMPGHYGGLVLEDQASASTIAYLVIEDAGKSGIWGAWDAGFIILGAEDRPVVKHLTVSHSGTNGISVARGGAFGAGSEAVSVDGSRQYAAFFDQPDLVGSMPPGSTFAGNTPNALLVKPGVISHSQRWANFGVPYVVDGIIDVQGTGTPVLTIEAGNELRFSADAGLHVGYAEAGELVAQGTAEHPIRFTSDAAQHQAGQWEGIVIDGYASATTVLDHVIVEYAGANSTSGYANANVQVIGDKGAIVRNTEVHHSAGCGITRAEKENQGFATDFTSGELANTFGDNPGGAQCGPE